jgi:hypothetical protein
MKAAPGDDAKAVSFAFTGGGNMTSRDEMHMDSLTLTFVDAKRLRHDWSMWKDGKVVRHVVLDFARAE